MRENVSAWLGVSLPTGATWSIRANNTNTNTDVRDCGGAFSNENGFVGVEVRQPLLRNLGIDSNRLGIELSELDLLDSESLLLNQLMNLVTNVEFGYYDLIAARDRLMIFRQSYDLADRLVKSHQKQVDAGRMAPLDVKQAQAAVASADAALFAARNQVTQAEIALKLLMTADFASWADVEVTPTTEMQQRVMADVLNALNSVESSAERVRATVEARKFAEVALGAEETKRLNGKSTNFIVLQLQADLTQARLNEILAIVDYNRALATLALREASTLERHSISLEDRKNSNDDPKP
ncbi:MAG: outer membrane protein TolC [Verrucomicrobiales bacterium]|jgi:outer membrane protein TolC